MGAWLARKRKSMTDNAITKKIAVLIDAENTSHTVLKSVFIELAKHGHIVIKRAYGDWSSACLKNWKSQLNELAIMPVQQFAYTQGKNSSDAALIIDAMDLLYSNTFNAFAIVSSDSDFTRLASRLRESHTYVFGVGEKKTPISFRNACDDFIYTEILVLEDMEDKNISADSTSNFSVSENGKTRLSRNELCQNPRFVSLLRSAIRECEEEDGWAHLGKSGQYLKRQQSDFDPRNYGYTTLTSLIEATELFDIDRREKGKSGYTVYVKDKRREKKLSNI
jgi:uncharacterized LabA/DUF88 family protein